MKPIIGITMGAPCGIGPEITAKALSKASVYETCRPLVVGSARVLQQAAAIAGSKLSVRKVFGIAGARFECGTADVWDQDLVDVTRLERGKVSAEGGNAAYRAVEEVIRLALDGIVDATVTGPLNKEAMNLAGWHFSGHTEIYGALTGAKHYSMMLAEGDLRVVHVSTHVSLREACDRCRRARILDVIRLAHSACRSLGIPAPRVGVAGLNPHAGENGLFGREEIDEITPAVLDAVAEGILAEGPLPADTLFSKARGGMYDIVVAQYHDQGHIPLKLIGFRYDHASGGWSAVSGVNITLGLPIIRCSVDHGTAFDQAGKGSASDESLMNAIAYAVRMASSKAARNG